MWIKWMEWPTNLGYERPSLTPACKAKPKERTCAKLSRGKSLKMAIGRTFKWLFTICWIPTWGKVTVNILSSCWITMTGLLITHILHPRLETAQRSCSRGSKCPRFSTPYKAASRFRAFNRSPLSALPHDSPHTSCGSRYTAGEPQKIGAELPACIYCICQLFWRVLLLTTQGVFRNIDAPWKKWSKKVSRSCEIASTFSLRSAHCRTFAPPNIPSFQPFFLLCHLCHAFWELVLFVVSWSKGPKKPATACHGSLEAVGRAIVRLLGLKCLGSWPSGAGSWRGRLPHLPDMVGAVGRAVGHLIRLFDTELFWEPEVAASHSTPPFLWRTEEETGAWLKSDLGCKKQIKTSKKQMAHLCIRQFDRATNDPPSGHLWQFLAHSACPLNTAPP